MYAKRILISACGLLTVIVAIAQADSLQQKKGHTFTLDAELQARGEWRNGAMPDEGNGEDHASFISGHAQLTMDYQQKNLEVKVVPIHSGVWGENGGGDFNLSEAWVLLTADNGLFAKVGRQLLSYDDERVIGDNDWAMAADSHDVLKIGYDGKLHHAHLILAFNQNSENVNGGTYYMDGAQPYKSMQTLWYHIDPCKQLGGSLLFMNVGMQNPGEGVVKTELQQLFGAYIDWHPENFRLQTSYYRQTGHDEYGLPIKAWMASAEADWDLHPKLSLNSGYFHMSGDEYYFVPPEGSVGMARKTEVCGFNPIFGSHHEFYGAMDFFYVKTYYGGNTPGLQDFHVGAEWKPCSSVTLDATYHYLATSVKVQDVGKTLGHEIELSASWDVMKDVKLSAGYSFMKGTDTMEVLKRSSDHNRLQWGWVMITVSPTFFSLNW